MRYEWIENAQKGVLKPSSPLVSLKATKIKKKSIANKEIKSFFQLRLFATFFPLQISENSYDDVKSIKAGLEGNILVEVESACDHVNDNPHEPLFEVFPGKSPDADDAQRRGEGIQDRYPGVGKTG